MQTNSTIAREKYQYCKKMRDGERVRAECEDAQNTFCNVIFMFWSSLFFLMIVLSTIEMAKIELLVIQRHQNMFLINYCRCTREAVVPLVCSEIWNSTFRKLFAWISYQNYFGSNIFFLLTIVAFTER